MLKNTNHTKASFVMSVLNGGEYLEKSIESILSQTYKNFELIIVDDGSKDETLKILKNKAKKDKRIKILVNKINLGLTQSLINAIKQTSSEIIVRQDADEVSKKNRLEKLLKYYDDKSVVAVGSNCINIYSNNLQSSWGYLDENQIKNKIKYKTIFPHGSSSFRANRYYQVKGYDTNYKTCQDFDLWNKLFKTGRILMCKEILLERYILKNSISKKRRFRQLLDSLKIRTTYNNPFNIKIYVLSLIYFIISFIPENIYFIIKKYL